MSLTYADKLLPTQAEQLKRHRGSKEDAVHAITDLCLRVNPPSKFKLVDMPDGLASLEDMASPPTMLAFLELLVGISSARNILEIGTFVGLGTMHMAYASRGRVKTIESFSLAAATARANFALNGLDRNIDLIEGDAVQTLYDQFGRTGTFFDFVYIDGGKENYAAYLDILSGMVLPGAVLVIDDVFFNGDVLNDHPETAKGYGARDAIRVAQEHKHRYESVLLPIGNGVLVLRKK